VSDFHKYTEIMYSSNTKKHKHSVSYSKVHLDLFSFFVFVAQGEADILTQCCHCCINKNKLIGFE
jgi:hypothetical protein